MASSRFAPRLSWHAFIVAAAVTGLLTACGGNDDAVAAAPVDTSQTLTLDGTVKNPRTYNTTQLEALPAVTETVSFSSGSASAVPHTYTGTRLSGLLDTAVIQVNGTPNNLLNKVVVATAGSDGYRVLFSSGELHPSYGNRGNVIAYAETASGVSSTLPGQSYRVTAPGDGKGGRYVSDLVHLEVKPAASTKGAAPGGPGYASEFTLTGVTTPATYDLASLSLEPAVDVTVGTDTYRGTSLWGLIKKGGLPPLPGKNADLRYYVVATGTDGVQILFTLGELDKDFGNKQVLVAYQLTNASGTGPLAPNRGFARLVVPDETVMKARWLFNLYSLEVFAVP